MTCSNKTKKIFSDFVSWMRIFACLEMCPAERVGRLRVETNSATNNSGGNFLLIQFEAVHCPANKGSLGKPQRQTNPIHPSTVWIPHYIVIENQVQPGTAGYKNILNHSKAGKEDENGWEWMKWFIQFSWTCSLNIAMMEMDESWHQCTLELELDEHQCSMNNVHEN